MLIVDDEILVRSGLGLIVGSAPDLEVVGDCSGGQAEELVQRLRPHVVLLDIRMPDLDGISVLRRLRALPDPPAVAMLTTFDTDEYIGTALRAAPPASYSRTPPPSSWSTPSGCSRRAATSCPRPSPAP